MRRRTNLDWDWPDGRGKSVVSLELHTFRLFCISPQAGFRHSREKLAPSLNVLFMKRRCSRGKSWWEKPQRADTFCIRPYLAKAVPLSLNSASKVGPSPVHMGGHLMQAAPQAEHLPDRQTGPGRVVARSCPSVALFGTPNGMDHQVYDLHQPAHRGIANVSQHQDHQCNDASACTKRQG